MKLHLLLARLNELVASGVPLDTDVVVDCPRAYRNNGEHLKTVNSLLVYPDAGYVADDGEARSGMVIEVLP